MNRQDLTTKNYFKQRTITIPTTTTTPSTQIGAALGGGLEWAISHDLRVASGKFSAKTLISEFLGPSPSEVSWKNPFSRIQVFIGISIYRCTTLDCKHWFWVKTHKSVTFGSG